MVERSWASHFDWKDTDNILAWATQHDRGDHYYVFNAYTGEATVVSPDRMMVKVKGVVSVSPSGWSASVAAIE